VRLDAVLVGVHERRHPEKQLVRHAGHLGGVCGVNFGLGFGSWGFGTLGTLGSGFGFRHRAHPEGQLVRHAGHLRVSRAGLGFRFELGFKFRDRACAEERLICHLALAGWVWVFGLRAGFWVGY
jgi:hypothetical protein